MKIKVQSRSVSVDMEGVDEDDIDEIAGMLRGLACSIEGFKAVSGMTNKRFWTERPVKWTFSSVENANYFRTCVKYYFSKKIRKELRVSRRIRRVG